MFAFKVLCLFLSVAAVFGDGTARDTAAELIFKTCIAETKLTPEEIKGFRSMNIPKTQGEKCMMGCLMRKVNVIKNGKFAVDEATKVAQTYYGTNEVMMNKAKQIIETCSKKAQSATDECSLAGIVTTCIVEEAQKAGLSGGPGNRAKRHISPKFRKHHNHNRKRRHH